MSMLRIGVLMALFLSMAGLSGCGWGGMLWCMTFTPHEDCAP